MNRNPLVFFAILIQTIMMSCKFQSEDSNQPDVDPTSAVSKSFATDFGNRLAQSYNEKSSFKLKNWDYKKNHYILDIGGEVPSFAVNCSAQFDFVVHVHRSGRIYNYTMKPANDCAREMIATSSALKSIINLMLTDNISLSRHITGY